MAFRFAMLVAVLFLMLAAVAFLVTPAERPWVTDVDSPARVKELQVAEFESVILPELELWSAQVAADVVRFEHEAAETVCGDVVSYWLSGYAGEVPASPGSVYEVAVAASAHWLSEDAFAERLRGWESVLVRCAGGEFEAAAGVSKFLR